MNICDTTMVFNYIPPFCLKDAICLKNSLVFAEKKLYN